MDTTCVPQKGRLVRAPHDGRLPIIRPSCLSGKYLFVVLDRGERLVEVVQQTAPVFVLS